MRWAVSRKLVMAPTRRRYSPQATAHQAKYGFRYRPKRNAQSSAQRAP